MTAELGFLRRLEVRTIVEGGRYMIRYPVGFEEFEGTAAEAMGHAESVYLISGSGGE